MENRQRFTNKHIFITGAARGIGFEIARHFAREGAVLSLIDFHTENLTQAVQQLKAQSVTVYSYLVNVANRQAVAEAVKEADTIQPIDVLINNAGIASETPFLNIEEEEWKTIIEVN